MGTVINEVGSSAGGIAKVEYKDEAGNVLWYYDDAGNFVRNGNAKITGLAGTGNRVVVADSSGSLSATTKYSYFLSGTLNATPVSTGISINAGAGGCTILAHYSTHSGDGDNTNSTITMIRCGYNGDNFSAVDIATSGLSTIKPVYSQVGGILYVATSSSPTAVTKIKFEYNV